LNLSDFLITPVLIVIILFTCWRFRSRYCDIHTRRYFLPALLLKISGAIILGFIYQYYYGGGDTFSYHTHGSRIIWEALWRDPVTGIKLFFANGIHQSDFYHYSSRIWNFRDLQSYWVIRVAVLFDLITFGTYSGTAVLFAVVSFSGSWALFQTFYSRFPQWHLPLAISIFFVPSVVIWSSGILKDTLTMAAIGWTIYCFDRLLIQKKVSLKLILVSVIAIILIYHIKIFILLVLVPSLIVWYFTENITRIKRMALRILIAPLIFAICTLFVYLAINNVTRNDRKYALDKISKTAQVTAYDIRYWTGKDAGSGYSLGELDGSISSLIRIAPKGLMVTYFRPYLWEVRNPLMLLSSLEGIIFLMLVIFALVKSRISGLFKAFKREPIVIFSVLFSVGYAIAVGVSTYNFGSLSRYKVPCIPFLLLALAIILFYSKREKNFSLLDSIE